jgi:O-antigen ligase
MLVLVLVGMMFLPLGRRLKWVIVGGVLFAGLAGFGWRYSGYFNRGATSVGARFDYWQGALHTVRTHPLLGTGPGTFGETYAQYQKSKRSEGEFPRLAHNDYLQQASDSGVPGCLFYGAFVIISLVYAGRKVELRKDWLRLAVWLGLLGWALQGLMEFGLYIPAIAWPAFTFMGWLLGQVSAPQTANPSTGAARPGNLAQP